MKQRKFTLKANYLVEVDVEISADSLISSFYNNKILADMKFSDKKLLVEGEIWTTYYRGDRIFVQLGNSEFDPKVEFSFDIKQSNQFDVGKNISIVGLCEGLNEEGLIKLEESKVF